MKGSLRGEGLEARVVLDASGFAGNVCAPNLDLSGIAQQEVTSGQTLTLDLLAEGGTAVDLDGEGNATGDTIRFQLDPDIGTDTPEGASITPEGVFSWRPTSDQVGTFEIIVISVDQGTPPLADAERFTVVVNESTSPIIDLNGPELGLDVEVDFVEDGGNVQIGPNLTLSDPDSVDLASVVIRLLERPDGEAESLSFVTLGANVAGEYDASTGELVLTGSEPIETYQQILRTVTYDNVSENPDTSPRIVEVTVSDGTFNSEVATTTISVEAVNDAPAVDLNGGEDGEDQTATFTEDGGPVSIVAADATVSDVDSETLESATLQIVNLLDDSGELLAADTEGTAIEATYNALTGTLVLAGEDSLENYQQVLRSVTYDNARQNANTEARTIQVSVSDGFGTSDPRVSTVILVAMNDAPDLEPIEDQTATVGQPLSVELSSADIDGDVMTFQLDRDDPDASIPTTAQLVDGAANGQATIEWTPAAEDGAGPFTFVVLVTDDNAEPLSDRETFTVSLVGDQPSEPPEVDLNGDAEGTGFDASFSEGGGPVSVVGADFAITDTDSDNLVGATATITPLADGESELLAVDTEGTAITATYDAVSGELELSGTDSLENYQQVLGTLVYDNSAQAPSVETRTINVTVNDGASDSTPVTATVEVVPLNNLPNLTLPSPFDLPAPVQRPQGELISFAASATDVDGNVTDITYILDLEDSGILSTDSQPTITSPSESSAGGDFNWTPDSAGVFVITVIAIDAEGGSDQETFSLEITPEGVAAALADSPAEDAIDALFALPEE